MIKIVIQGENPDKPKKVICQKCQSVLEYNSEDIIEGEIQALGLMTWQSKSILCPVCEIKIGVQ